MLTLKRTAATFTTPVAISIAGAAEPMMIEAEFRYLKKKELTAFFASPKDDEAGLAEILVGWSGVDTPYSSEALTTLLDEYPAAARDFFGAFRRELMEAKKKNS